MISEKLAKFEIAEIAKNPKQLLTDEECQFIINQLSDEIAIIDAERDVFDANWFDQLIPDDEAAWYHRATTAASYKRQQRYKIIKRSKELRGITQQAKHDPAVKIAKYQKNIEKQKAQQEIAAAKRVTNAAKHEALQIQRQTLSLEKSNLKMFKATAYDLLDEDKFNEIRREADRRVGIKAEQGE